MELLCPNCQQKISVPDQYAGQVMKCPMCQGLFTAPTLAGIPTPPPVPPPPPQPLPVETYGLAPEPVPPPPVPPPVQQSVTPPAPAPTPVPAPPPAPAPEPEPEPSPPGEYSRTWTLSLSREILMWFAPIGLTVLFFLSFFTWTAGMPLSKDLENLVKFSESPAAQKSKDVIEKTKEVIEKFLKDNESLEPKQKEPLEKQIKELEVSEPKKTKTAKISVPGSRSFWGLAFSEDNNPWFTMDLIMVFFLAWPLSIGSLLLGKKWIPRPPALKLIMPWRAAIVGGLVLLGFLFFLAVYLQFLFSAWNPATFWMKLAFRVHFLVVLSLAAELWLEQRKRRSLPPPRAEVRW